MTHKNPDQREPKKDGESPAPAETPAAIPSSTPSQEFPRSFNPVLLARKLEELEKKSSTGVRKLERPLRRDETRSGGTGAGRRPAPNAIKERPAPPQSASGREERVACSFPGIMKVLIPERSFLPFPLAVRVANISPGGALIEVHDKTKLDQDIALPNRFFELKVAHPDIPLLRGTIAWSDMSRTNPLLGLSSFEKHLELAQIITSDSALGYDGPPPLPAPIMDPFPPVVHEETLVISGLASEALEIIVKREDLRFEAKVKRGRFEIKLELEPNQENHFTLRSIAGERKSRPIPIRIVCEKPMDDRRFRFQSSMTVEKGGAHQLKLEFQGSMRQAELVLYRFSQLMANSEFVTVTGMLEAQTPFDRRMYEGLRSEGAVLAADTGRNEAASKLLEELL